MPIDGGGNEDEDMRLLDGFTGPDGTRALEDLVNVRRKWWLYSNVTEVGSPFGFAEGTSWDRDWGRLQNWGDDWG
jgi:hypothetical protein